MTIHDLSIKFKEFIQNTDVLLSVLIVVISLSSFALGRYSAQENKGGIDTKQQKNSIVNTHVEQDIKAKDDYVLISETQAPLDTKGGYVASKNGTKYHLPWCSGARRIKEENKVFFNTKEEAEKAGYIPASNCKGI